MSQSLRIIRAFSMELMKTAADIQDADIQSLVAERNGKEYLMGGRLASNTAAEAQYVVKMSGLPTPESKHHHQTYQKARDYATAGAKGALTGIGLMGAHSMMRGRFGVPQGPLAIRRAASHARMAAGAGAAAGIADKAYNGRYQAEKKAFVQASPNTSFGSPASSLATSQRTGGFESSVAHKIGKPPAALQLGKRFRMP